MKILKHYILILSALMLIIACNKGIDPISYVEPGPDATAPVIKIVYPLEGTSIQVPQLVASINIKLEVTDDIEIKSISVKMDGTEIASYNTFKDYRRALVDFLYTNLTSGLHTLTVEAIDKENKKTTASVNFEKKPPYTPLYAGEAFYMPFDGDFVEKISFASATVVGSPGYAGESLKGLNAYKGANDSYLTYPIANLTANEFSAAFWYKVNASPDRSGILNVSPAGEDRTKGFRLFREGNATEQRIKLNVGTGSGETWNDGDVIAAPGTKWVHVAFTISQTACVIYINGEVARSVPNTGIDWTDCTVLGIGSGAPNFTYWNHKSDISLMDELRLFKKALTKAEVQKMMNDDHYMPKYPGEVLYMPFEGKFLNRINNTEATVVGSPTFADAGKKGKAYAGAANSYITVPTAGITGASYSGVFWYKVNASPDRSGILNASITGEDRTKGFRLFREGNASKQRIKLNIGTGAGEVWNDGKEIDAPGTDWVQIAFTVSPSAVIIYVNGEIAANSATTAGIDWTGCGSISIGSGGPNFTYWGHGADLSLIDELRLYNSTLTQAQIQTIYADESK
jgi:hypothetical protein